jgi:hypothetical protein
MAKIKDLLSLEGFSPEEIDTSNLNKIAGMLPVNGVIDINIAEQGLIFTLEGQNACQEKIALLDRYIGLFETKKNKAWSNAALNKAKEEGHKTAKDKEWFAQADDEYIEICNKLTMAKATKKWFENKANYFFGWHYTFKTFLRRDYPIEKSSNLTFGAFDFSEGDNSPEPSSPDIEVNSDDIEWE